MGSPEGNSALAVVARVTLIIAATALCALAVVQGWQVFARYVLNDAPSWTEPLALLLMNFAMMFGAAAGAHSGTHFGFFLLPQALTGLPQRLLLSASNLVCAGIALLLSVWAARLVVDGWSVTIAGTALPQGINYLPLACGGALIGLFSLSHLWQLWRSSAGT